MSDQLEYLNLLEELKLRQSHPGIAYVPCADPMCNQLAFHNSDAWCRLVFGGNRSGKSRAGAQEDYWWFTQTHPYLKTPKAPRIWVLSAEYRTIYEGVWSHLRNVIPHWDIAKTGPKVPNWDIPSYIESKSGARIDFISAQGGEETRKKIQAAEIDLLHVDEEVDGSLWIELQMRLVTRGGKVLVTATLIESEDWLLELEDKSLQGDPDVSITRLSTLHNIYNNQAAVARVVSHLSDEEKIVRIEGKRRKASGLIYANWNPLKHEIDPIFIPDEWTKLMVFDPGFRTAAALWIAIDPKQYAIAYREMYLHNTTLSEIADFIKASEKEETIQLRFIDPHAFDHGVDGSPGIGHRLLDDYKLLFQPGQNDKMTNIEDVRRWLLPDLTGTPQFRIFNTLEHFKSERRQYRTKPASKSRDRDDSPDRPLKRKDHLMNCWEYAATARVRFMQGLTESEMFTKLAKTPDDRIDHPDKNAHYFRIRIQKERKRLREQQERKYANG